MAYQKNDDKTVADFDAVRLAVASPDDILSWSYGEVLKPETINYRTQKPERDGLFCEKIFGPVKDINPHDAKLKGVRSREAAVDKNGELVTKSSARRERMGHIKLATPVAHIWFMRGVPSAMSLLLNLTVRNIERVAYFQSYIILSTDAERIAQLLADNEAEFEAGRAAIKIRYEKSAGLEQQEDLDENGIPDESPKTDNAVDIKALSAEMNRELEDLTENYNEKKQTLESLNKGALMSETAYRNLPEEYEDLVEVGMGGAALHRLLSEIDLTKLIAELTEEAEAKKGQAKKKIQKRLKMLEGMLGAGVQPESMTMTVLPVIPPDLRPMVQLTGGRFATSDLNDLYRRVINRNNRLKKLAELNAPEVITRNEMRMLQEAVDALIDNSATRGTRQAQSTGARRRLKSLSDLLKGKQGRFRQNLLGKRVDYSGRSVIVPGPELKMDECGLPKTMALELFKPFVISKLLEWEQAHNIRTAQRLIEAGDPVIWDALDEAIQGKYVLLNRAPTLHRLSIQAFKPKLIEGQAIQLSLLVLTGFNADFDGDQMAVHLPLSDEAQAEARDLMSATNNLLKPADGEPILNISQDVVLGCYYLTYDKAESKDDKKRAFMSIDEAILARDAGEIEYQTPIKLRMDGQTLETTLGRALFNELLPADFPFVNEPLTKKALSKTMARIFNNYGAEITADVADAVKDFAFEHATTSGISVAVDDYFTVDNLELAIDQGDDKVATIAEQYEEGLITNDERYNLTVKAWRDTDTRVLDGTKEKLENSDSTMALMTISGARGSVDNIKQAAAMIGIQVDATGHAIELPVKHGYKQGVTPLEAFVVTRGSRFGEVSKALKTADSGYLTRRLVDVAQDVFTIDDENVMKDPGFTIYRKESEETMIFFSDRIAGRYAAEDVANYVKKGELITLDIADAIQNDESVESVTILSALTTPELNGIPRKSYGVDMASGFLVAEAEPIGVIAAQSVGEPGTQLTLDTKHASGIGTGTSEGLARVDELFEARTPKGEAILSEIDGTISVRETDDNYVVEVTPTAGQTEEIALKDGQEVKVKNGATIKTGDVLATATDKDAEALPIVAPFDGIVTVTKKSLKITNAKNAPCKYEFPSYRQLVVADGDHVKAGDRLTTGSINLHDLMKLKGIEATQRYIINDVLRIYAAQGQNISPKHLEIIVRQMFSRVQIDEPGDSPFVAGDIVSKALVIDTNKQLASAGKQPAEFEQLLLGITKVSIYSDSFLSAASFQDTTRVLISAATSGRVDHLYGLKENVIIGRKIPVGTGVLSEAEFAEEQYDPMDTENQMEIAE